MPLATVLTGDIVDSQSLSPELQRRCLDTLRQMLNHCSTQFGALGEFYRGDAFQVYVDPPQHGLRIALLMRLALRAIATDTAPIDARIAVGLGPAEAPSGAIATARGEAFVASGRQLDEMKAERLAIASHSDTLQLFLPVVFAYLDDTISNLNTNAATAVLLKLMNPELTHQALAEKMGTGRTSYTRFLNRAGFQRINDTLTLFENAVCCDRFGEFREK
ncbi:hypothetical protein KUV89_03410 [Marinobacter hydrocarbonoclasticus]|nr:hypothetical protein [Marinobacter nauticus]